VPRNPGLWDTAPLGPPLGLQMSSEPAQSLSPMLKHAYINLWQTVCFWQRREQRAHRLRMDEKGLRLEQYQIVHGIWNGERPRRNGFDYPTTASQQLLHDERLQNLQQRMDEPTGE